MPILSWGANSHGQLSQGCINEQVEIPKEIEIDCKVRQIACGGGHSLLIDEDGKIFSCGWNHKLQQGNDKPEHCIFERIWNLSGIDFKEIACGWDFSLGLTSDEFLFVWGSNSHGQLGLPRSHFGDKVKPVRLQMKAKALSTGLRHSAIISFKDEVWVSGCGKHGQLGLGEDILNLDRFEKLENLSGITHIACGQNHTVAWNSNENALYAWGSNKHGQLLLNKEKFPKLWSPQKIDIGVNEKVQKLLSGWTNVALWLSSGKLLTWGRNTYGQLGSSILGQNNIALITLPGNRCIKDVALGSEHTICLAEDQTFWAWGWNEHGNTGTGNEECIYEPKLVELKRENESIEYIFAGYGHNYIVTAIYHPEGFHIVKDVSDSENM